jgi:hypothetical protein
MNSSNLGSTATACIAAIAAGTGTTVPGNGVAAENGNGVTAPAATAIATIAAIAAITPNSDIAAFAAAAYRVQFGISNCPF